MIQIDKSIPIPGRKREEYPWASMEIGDSFSVSTSKTGIRASAAWASRRYERRFISRSVTEDGVDVIRVWRIA